MTYFDFETDLYMEECDGETMPRTRVIQINDLIVATFMARYAYPAPAPLYDLSTVSLHDALLATRIVKRMPPEIQADGSTHSRCYVAVEAEVAALYTWALLQRTAARAV